VYSSPGARLVVEEVLVEFVDGVAGVGAVKTADSVAV
jgi:hypothetical protein